MDTKRAEMEKELEYIINNASDKGVQILLQIARKLNM